jgi:DNA-directed RNA polymerase subunit M/transcription elongation factor TFIIS
MDGKKTVLTCRSCGKVVKKFETKEYKIAEKVEHRHGDILVVEKTEKRGSEEERKYLVDLYGKETYELEE